MRQPADEWQVYGAVIYERRPNYPERVTREFHTEEEAWRAAIKLRLDSTECNVVIVHTTYRPGIKDFAGKWRPVNKVIWRCGMGRAWFE